MIMYLQMSDYYQPTSAHNPAQQHYQAPAAPATVQTPAHNPAQQLYQPPAPAPATLPPPQPQALPPPNNQPAAAPHPYGHTPQPTPYGYQGAPGEALPSGHVTKRPLEDGVVGPTPAKFVGVGRGRGRAKDPGHLWAWQQVGFFEDRPNPMPFCQAHRNRGCDTCFTYLSKKN